MTTIQRLPFALCVALCFMVLAEPAWAQRLVTESVTPEFTDYRLENPTLSLSPHYEMLIPFGRGSGSVRLLNVSYKIVEFESDTTDVFVAKSGSAALDAPLFETYNQGVFRKQVHAALKVNLTRPVPDRPRTYQVIEHVSFRVYNETSAPATVNEFTGTSPLASGIWYKIPIQRSGIYRLDRNYLASLTGLNIGSLDPRRIQIWAGSNAMLPMPNAAGRPEFMQIPIIVNGESDGRFDNDDAVIFYAQGPKRLVFNETTGRFKGETHLYANETYVFITVGSQNGLRMSPASAGSPSQTITTFTDVLFKEEEQFKITSEMRSGSEWLGERVTPGVGNTLTVVDCVLAGFVPGSTVSLELRFASRNRGNARFDIKMGNATVSSLNFGGLFNRYTDAESEFGYALDAFANEPNVTLTNNRLRFTAEYSSDTPSEAIGYLDYANVFVQRSLTGANGLLRFYSPSDIDSETWATYQLNGFTSAPLVFDVTNPQQPVQYAATSQGGNWNVVAPARRGRQFAAATSFISPAGAIAVENQHLRAVSGYPNYIIVAPDDPDFMPAAQELAEFRQSNDGLRPLIVTQGQIFNEYSGGVPDFVAIRDFVRHLYLKAGNVAEQLPQYLLLFGNATHDFRGIYSDVSEKNLVFTYQSRESFHRVDSYGSDDFYVLLDEEEGAWLAGTTSELIDLGVGRLPFNTPAEANLLVQKLKSYEDPSTYGEWRTLFTFAADDDIPEPLRNRDLHILNADSTAEFINKDASGVRLRKIYEINYPVETTSGSRFRPLATRDFLDSFNNGSLVINYSGHGAEQTLSDSRLFQSSDIPRLTNRDRLSIFVTATCSFGRFDDHLEQSGAEKTLLWPQGGIVAAFTTTRVVYTSEDPNSINFGLNRRLTGFMTERDVDGMPRRLGEIFWLTKNVTDNRLGGSFNTRKFILLGDPAMRIGLPRQKAQIDRVQGQVADGNQRFTLRGLDTVQIEGTVTLPDGSVNTGYNGEISLKVFDGTRTVQLPQRDWMSLYGCYLKNCRFREQNDLLFNGRVTVRNGLYSATFVVPKDISYSPNNGRLLVYGQSGNNDAVGSFSQIVFSGLNPDAQNDNRGPDMQVYLDSPEFSNGSMVGSNPKLIVELSDATGINATGIGVGHELVAILNTVPERTVVLNNYFESDLDNFRSGRIEYPLDGLEEGEYELTVRAWDVFNNPSEERITFRVADSEDIILSNVYNYPNPMHNRTRFEFQHNQPGNQLDVSVRIYTLSGRPVAQIEESRVFPTTLGNVEWLGFDNDNDRLATGTYLYVLKVTAETSKGRRSAEVVDKLVIIR